MRKFILLLRASIKLAALFVGIFFQIHGSLAQVAPLAVSHSELASKPSADQSALLSKAVALAWKGHKCATASVSFQRAYANGSGGWLIRCAEGSDYWAMVPASSAKGTLVLACIHARLAGTDCYANFKTVLPEHPAECAQSESPDRKIGGCTALIQSGRLSNNPKALAVAFQQRAFGFSRYNAFDLAIADFERAAALNPEGGVGEYNLAVALERRALLSGNKGDLDLAIASLNKALQLNPKLPFANFERGFVYLKKLDYDRAIEDFDIAIQLNPGLSKAYRQRGLAHKAKGNLVQFNADEAKARDLEAPSSSVR